MTPEVGKWYKLKDVWDKIFIAKCIGVEETSNRYEPHRSIFIRKEFFGLFTTEKLYRDNNVICEYIKPKKWYDWDNNNNDIRSKEE